MSRLIDVAAVLDRMANALRGTEQGEACAFAVKLMRERESMTDETQELADALEECIDSPESIMSPKLYDRMSADLARHRAKQEVQS